MTTPQIKVQADPFRWVMILLFAAVNMPMQALWIGYAPVAAEAERYYGVGSLRIALLSMLFALCYLIFMWPAARMIDRYGLHFSIGVASLLASTAGIARGLAGDNYSFAAIATVIIAACEAPILLAWAMLPDRWFEPDQRATALSIIALSTFLGMGIGMVTTAALVRFIPIGDAQLLYGGVMGFAAILFCLLARERPAVPVARASTVILGTRASIRLILRRPRFQAFLAMSWFLLGVFFAVVTWIQRITQDADPSANAGLVGAILLVGAGMGAPTMASISDIVRRRVPFLSAAAIVMGVTLYVMSQRFEGDAPWIHLTGFFFGYAIGTVIPIGLQYGTEIAEPASVLVAGAFVQFVSQMSVLWVFVLSIYENQFGNLRPVLTMLSVGCLALAVMGAVVLREPRFIVGVGSTPVELAPASPVPPD